MDLLVFDSDGTLFDDSEAKKQFFEILHAYFARLSGVPKEQAKKGMAQLRKKWDTTSWVFALMNEYRIDFPEIVGETYFKVDLEACAIPRGDVVRLAELDSLKGRKVVFTNSPSAFARHVLAHIGLGACFSDVMGIEELGFFAKPDPRSYQMVEKRHLGFKRIIFCDDSVENLEPARDRGWRTAWFNPKKFDVGASRGHSVVSSFKELGM